MSPPQLPTELLTKILAVHLPPIVSCQQYLSLRLVSAQVNDIMLYALFDLSVYGMFDLKNMRCFAQNKATVIRYWRSFIKNGAVSWKQERMLLGSTRKALQIHRTKFLSTLEYAIQELCASTGFAHQTGSSLPSLGSFLNEGGTLTPDGCVGMLCDAAMLVHGPPHVWDMLTTDVEEDFSKRLFTSNQLLTYMYHPDTWSLYGAAYMNDAQSVERLLEPLKVKILNQAIWERQLHYNYRELMDPSSSQSEHLGKTPVSTNMYKQRKWIKLTGAALIIAASLGHVELISTILRIEPNAIQLLFRTQFYCTSNRDAMGAAILNGQTEAFKLLLAHKWPLVTRPGFPRSEYYSALHMAVGTAKSEHRGDEILEGLLGMTDRWQFPQFLNIMLHEAAKQNDVKRGKLVLDHATKGTLKHPDYAWIKHAFKPKPSAERKIQYALAVAACRGHVEFVNLLLRGKRASKEADSPAVEAAIHSLTCLTEDLSNKHRLVLQALLKRADGLSLDGPFVGAAHRHDAQFLQGIVPKIDLKKKAGATQGARRRLRYCCDSDCSTSFSLVDSMSNPTLGQLALAASLDRLNYDTTYLLVKDYRIRLGKKFVSERMRPDERYSMYHLALRRASKTK